MKKITQSASQKSVSRYIPRPLASCHAAPTDMTASGIYRARHRTHAVPAPDGAPAAVKLEVMRSPLRECVISEANTEANVNQTEPRGRTAIRD